MVNIGENFKSRCCIRRVLSLVKAAEHIASAKLLFEHSLTYGGGHCQDALRHHSLACYWMPPASPCSFFSPEAQCLPPAPQSTGCRNHRAKRGKIDALRLRFRRRESQVAFQPMAQGSLQAICLDNRLAGLLYLRTPWCQAALLSIVLPRNSVGEAVSGCSSSRLVN